MHRSTHTESTLHSRALTRATLACHANVRVASFHNPRKHVNERMNEWTSGRMLCGTRHAERTHTRRERIVHTRTTAHAA